MRMRGLMAVFAAADGDFSLEHSEQKYKVSDGDDDAERPPDESDLHSILTRGRVLNGKAVRGVSAGREQRWIGRKRRTDQHGSEVDA